MNKMREPLSINQLFCRKDSELKIQAHDTANKKTRYVFVFDKMLLVCKAKGDHYSFKDSLKVFKSWRGTMRMKTLGVDFAGLLGNSLFSSLVLFFFSFHPPFFSFCPFFLLLSLFSPFVPFFSPCPPFLFLLCIAVLLYLDTRLQSPGCILPPLPGYPIQFQFHASS